MGHEQVRRHTSLTPAPNSQKQWVESNMSLLADINKLMAEVQKDVRYHIPIAHVDTISSNTGVSQYLRAPLIPWNSSQRSPTDLRLLLKPSVDQSFLTDEREARAAAYLFWIVLQPVLQSSELNEIMQNTVVALKREGKQTFSSLAAGQQGVLQFALKPLHNMFSRALVKAFAIKHRLRLVLLGSLRPFALFEKLLSSSLLCPGLFPDSSWAEASDLLRQAMDSPALRAWDGKVPSINPSPSSRHRPFRAALPPPRASRSSPRPWRSESSAGCSSRRSDLRGEHNARFSRGRGSHSSRGRSSHTSSTGGAPRQTPTPAAVLGDATIPAANTTTVPPTTTPDSEVVPAPPPAIEADSPAAPSRSGARLTFFAPAWVAAPPSIQTIVRRGFHWTWFGRPPRLRPPSYSQSRPDLLLPVQDWVAKGVVYPVPHQPCFQSRIFTVPRPDERPPVSLSIYHLSIPSS